MRKYKMILVGFSGRRRCSYVCDTAKEAHRAAYQVRHWYPKSKDWRNPRVVVVTIELKVEECPRSGR